MMDKQSIGTKPVLTLDADRVLIILVDCTTSVICIHIAVEPSERLGENLMPSLGVPAR
jgi:hypothetical protein